LKETAGSETLASGGERTILFGGSGFLGPYLLERCPKMISVGRKPPPTANRHIQIPGLEDLRALDDVDFDKVVYIIGNTDHHTLEKERLEPGEPNAFDYHVIPLLRAMEQLRHRPIRKLIHFSTILIYDEAKLTLPVSEHAPIDPYKNRYTMSKYLAEEACKFYAKWVPIINCRFCNLYGPTPLERYDLIHVLCKKLLADGQARIWSRKPKRDFIYVDDAADAILKLLDTDYTGTLNLGTGTMTSIGHVADVLAEISGYTIMSEERPVSGPMEFRADRTTLDRLIDWEPRVGIEEGIERVWRKTKQWMRAG